MTYHRNAALLLIVILVSLLPSYCYASVSELGIIQIGEEIDLPKDLDFTVNDECTGHAYFLQADADATGRYLVCSRHFNTDDYSDVDFKKVYIDIYNPDGTFLQELSFTTPLSCAAELEGDSVYICFYMSVLVYDLTTKEVHHFELPDGERERHQQLTSKEFTAGNWTYRCKKGLIGYVKLLRSEGEQMQVLVEMPGAGRTYLGIFIPGVMFGIIILIIDPFGITRKFVKKRRST